MKAVWKFLTSLRLTVVLLVLGIIVVFVGTVAQADEGLYNAQERYFKHWIIVGASMFGKQIPIILPGGYTLGVGLLINLVAAHIHRFKWSTAKIGIHLTHLGIIILLVGQLATDMLQVESRMSFTEGQKASYVEHHRSFELAFLSQRPDGQDDVVVIPESYLEKPGTELAPPELPFTIRVKEFHLNAQVRQRAPMMDKGEPPATKGMGPQATLIPLPEAKDMDSKNMSAAVIEIVEKGESLGTWLIWAALREQEIKAGGKTFRMTLRDERVYLPFSLTLLQATHKKYAGSDTPRDFRSRVKIENAQTHENRETEISMNSPLRYGGLAFFQYQMTKDELDTRNPGSSVLQVVRNPSWLAPYIGCIVVSIGMLWQFMHHLVGFMSKRRTV